MSSLLHWLAEDFSTAQDRLQSAVKQAALHASYDDPVLHFEARLLRSWCAAAEILWFRDALIKAKMDVADLRLREAHLRKLVDICQGDFMFQDPELSPFIRPVENAYLQDVLKRVVPLTDQARDVSERLFSYLDPNSRLRPSISPTFFLRH